MKENIIPIILLVLSLSSLPLRAQKEEVDTLRASSITISGSSPTGRCLIFQPDLARLVSPVGRADAVKFIQTLPGVAVGAEGSSSFFVRGGNKGGNLVTIDGVPLYGSGHILGFSSSYPQEIVEETRFFVGGFSSEEGNLTSSHIKVSTKDGDFQKCSGNVSVDPLLIGGAISGPIVKDRISIIGSLRISPLGFDLRAVKRMTAAMDGVSNIKASVYDAFGKIKWKISDKQNLAISTFASRDSYGYEYAGASRDKIGWWNNLVSINHDQSLGDRWRVENSLSLSHFHNSQGMSKLIGEKDNELLLQSGLEELSLRSTALWSGKRGWDFQSGVKARTVYFKSGITAGQSKDFLASAHAQVSKQSEGKYELRIAGRVNRTKFFFNPEYSFTGRVFFSKWMGVEVSSDKTVQYYHTLEGLPLGWSLDLIVPSDVGRVPEEATQHYGGLFLSGNTYRLSIGAYTKEISNIIFFEDASQLFSPAIGGWKESVKIGSGRSKGLELLYSADYPRFDANFSYTLSKTDRSFPDLNDGKPFPAKFDRRHILNARLEYLAKKTERRELGIYTFFTYQSGHWTTVAEGRFSGIITPGDREIVIEYHQKGIHNWQTPPYIRWDAGISLRYGIETNHPGKLNVGIYNLLNRHNIYSIMYDPVIKKWKSLSIFPIMPAISWTMDF